MNSHMRSSFLRCLCTVAVLSSSALARSPEPHKIKLALERLQNGAWSAVEPGLVLNHGDRVRFKVQTNFPGYLYVVNYGTSGNYSVLLPSKEAGGENKLVAGQSRQVPSGDFIFRISGPAGQDIVYWIVSPVVLPGYGANPLPEKPKRPAVLLPRCDDTLLRARGECIDSSAGTRDLDGDIQVPGAPDSLEKPPDLTFLREDKDTIVATSGSSQGPMVYEFRIAHK